MTETYGIESKLAWYFDNGLGWILARKVTYSDGTINWYSNGECVRRERA